MSDPNTQKDITQNIDISKSNYREKFIRNLLNYLTNYGYDHRAVYLQSEVVSRIVRDAKQILIKEPTVVNTEGPLCVVGPLYGHGDSLIQLFAFVGRPCKMRFIFLGNYAGQGFAPHEVLFLLLALKIHYPSQIILLKGEYEDAPALESMNFVEGLFRRKLIQKYDKNPNALLLWQEIKEVVSLIPLAATIGNTFLCVPGGIGPTLMSAGLDRLRKVKRPFTTTLDEDRQMAVETVWSTLRLENSTDTEILPSFSEADVKTFCAKNGIKFIIRGRQMIEQGFLNRPRQMLTLTTSENYLSTFENYGAVLVVGKDHTKGLIRRFYSTDPPCPSHCEIRPAAGVNCLPTATAPPLKMPPPSSTMSEQN